MSVDDIQRIDDWFAERDGDGEFARHSRGVAYLIVGPITDGGRAILTTKPRIFAAALGELGSSEREVRDVSMVGRYGLPAADDLKWIRAVLGDARPLFLGDMDPVDLLIYAWLKAQAEMQDIEYMGVHDRLLCALGISFERCVTCSCLPSECDSLDLLVHVLPGLREFVGADCYSALENGQKIELESLVSATGNPVAVLRAALA